MSARWGTRGEELRPGIRIMSGLHLRGIWQEAKLCRGPRHRLLFPQTSIAANPNIWVSINLRGNAAMTADKLRKSVN